MSEPPGPPKRSVYKNMLVGSLWALALRWGIHSIGIVSVAILARLLTPADFGIVAMGSLLAALIGVFTDMGASILLLRTKDITREDIDTAWTIALLQGAFVATVLVVISPFAVKYFSEPRLLPVIWTIAACSVIGSTGNMGMTLVRKNLDFAKDFRFGIYTRLVTFVLTVSLALWLRNYWALVFAQFFGTILNVMISYRMHPYRPRLSLAKTRQYLSFSVGMMGWNIGRFLKTKVDVFVIGGNTNAAVMGSYNVASELASMSTQEVVVPVWRGLFPTFATITHDHQRFIIAYGHFISVMALLCLPLGLGLGAVAEDCVLVVLGQQWTAAIPPLKWLAIGATILAMIEVFGGNVLFVTHHERRAAALMWVHLAVLFPAVAWGAKQGNVEAMAIATTVAAAIQLPVAAVTMIRSLDFPVKTLLRSLWRPAIAVGVMLLVLRLMPAPAAWPAVVRLVEQIALGAVVYLSCIAALWFASNQPEGPENAVWLALQKILGRRAS